MKKSKLLFLSAAFMLINALFPQTTHANGVGGNSASLTKPTIASIKTLKNDDRAEILQKYLIQYNSPLAPHAKTFIEQADKHNLDWKVVAAIAGDESGFGHQIPPYSNNAWGFGIYGNNTRGFASWDEGISVVSEALRTTYLGDLEETNVYVIGHKYASDPMWAAKVSNYMYSIDTFAARFTQPTISLSL